MSHAERIWLRGEDAGAYLDSQCAQDLSALPPGGEADALVLDPSGTIVALCRVRRVDDVVFGVEVPFGVGAALRSRLERFALRTSVEFSGPEPVEESAWLPSELARVSLGVPGPRELSRGLVPHGLAPSVRDRAVSFTKGCYPGQELVARMQSRGASAPWLLRTATLSAQVEPGTALGDAERAGEVTTVVRDDLMGAWRALCVIHRRDAVRDELEVRGSPGVVARLEDDPSLRSGRADAP